jgi:U3 small nucleolar ribonucleoprotein protein IMP4
MAGIRDPKVCITTSRDPSSRLKQFTVEMKLVVPNSQRINRGNTTIKEIVDAAREADFTDIIVLQETRGEPDALIVSHLPYGPSAFFSLSNTVMRHDIEKRGTVSEAYPHLVFNNFKTALGERIRTILTHLFPVPKEDSKRVMTFANDTDFISFRHHTYDKAETAKPGAPLSKKDVVLTEVGPRFELHPYMVRLGTVDQEEAETEWALRSFINTARKTDKL